MHIDFNTFFQNHNLENERNIAAAVSGGADSMALAHMIAQWNTERPSPAQIHVLTVDHGLREEAAQEAKYVGDIVNDWPHCQHQTLRWNNEGVDSRIQENARAARYALMKEYMDEHSITVLFVAHHMDDQAETFLIRLAKGSGLDGLSCMNEVQNRNGINIYRPALHLTHKKLMEYCLIHKIEWVEDPSNQNEDFMRPRLRMSKQALDAEGLTSKRLSTTAKRIDRAKEALEYYAEKFWKDNCKLVGQHIEIEWNSWLGSPEDIRVRIIQKALAEIGHQKTYAPRLERVEDLATALTADTFKGQTLGGCIIKRDDQSDKIIVMREAK